MPLCESTYASAGRDSKHFANAASTSGMPWIFSYTAPKPLFGLTPAALRAGPCAAKASLKKTSTAWPNMIGSDTFIIVAL